MLLTVSKLFTEIVQSQTETDALITEKKAKTVSGKMRKEYCSG